MAKRNSSLNHPDNPHRDCFFFFHSLPFTPRNISPKASPVNIIFRKNGMTSKKAEGQKNSSKHEETKYFL